MSLHITIHNTSPSQVQEVVWVMTLLTALLTLVTVTMPELAVVTVVLVLVLVLVSRSPRLTFRADISDKPDSLLKVGSG